jgi:hypothetical protein
VSGTGYRIRDSRERRFQVLFPGKKLEQYAVTGRTRCMNVGGMTFHALTGANARSRPLKKEPKRDLPPCPPLDFDLGASQPYKPDSRRAAKCAKKTKDFSFGLLCALAPSRELF